MGIPQIPYVGLDLVNIQNYIIFVKKAGASFKYSYARLSIIGNLAYRFTFIF